MGEGEARAGRMQAGRTCVDGSSWSRAAQPPKPNPPAPRRARAPRPPRAAASWQPASANSRPSPASSGLQMRYTEGQRGEAISKRGWAHSCPLPKPAWRLGSPAALPCTLVLMALRSASARTLQVESSAELVAAQLAARQPSCSQLAQQMHGAAHQTHRLSGEARPLMGRRRPASVATQPCWRAAAFVRSIQAATPRK